MTTSLNIESSLSVLYLISISLLFNNTFPYISYVTKSKYRTRKICVLTHEIRHTYSPLKYHIRLSLFAGPDLRDMLTPTECADYFHPAANNADLSLQVRSITYPLQTAFCPEFRTRNLCTKLVFISRNIRRLIIKFLDLLGRSETY